MLHLSASSLTRGPTSVPAMWSSTTSGSTAKLSGNQEEGEDEDDGRIGGSHRLTVAAPISHLLMKIYKRFILNLAVVGRGHGVSPGRLSLGRGDAFIEK